MAKGAWKGRRAREDHIAFVIGFDAMGIGSADATGMHLDDHIVETGIGIRHLDADQLGVRDLHLRPWLRASDAAWSHAWEGGDLTQAALSGDPVDPLNVRYDASPLLAADLVGSFPTARKSADGDLVLEDAGGTVPGRLTWVGSSAPFRAAHLHAPGADHAQLLLHAVARLT